MAGLKEVLVANRISYTTFAAAVKQSNGRPLSKSAVSNLVNLGAVPKWTSLDSIRKQAGEFFKTRGIDTAIDWTIFHSTLKDTPLHTGGSMITERPILEQETVKYFSLKRNPFSMDTMSYKDLYLSRYQQYVMNSMVDAATENGFIAIIGDPGSGKTSLACDLTRMCQANNNMVVTIRPKHAARSRVTAQSIYDAIILQLSPGTSVPTKAEHSAAKAEKLLKEGKKGSINYVLVLDDAQDMHLNTLLSVKGFWDVGEGFERLLGVILIGQPELNDILSARNPSAMRLAMRVEKILMAPYSVNDMKAYLTMKLQKTGLKLLDVFTEPGVTALHKHLAIADSSGGEPRSQAYPLLINNAVLACMNWVAIEGVKIGVSKIDEDAVKEVRNAT